MPLTLERTLVMPDRATIVQDFDIHDGTFYLSQDSKEKGTCVISRVRDGKALDSMVVPGSSAHGTHGDRLDLKLSDKRDVLVRLKFAGRYILIPYLAGRSWSAVELLQRVISHTEPDPPPGDDFQGEVCVGGWVIRTYGAPYKIDGPTWAGNTGVRHRDNPGRMDIARDGRIVRKVSLSHLGRRPDLTPLDVRLEPEGVCHEAGHIKVGCAIGPLNRLSQQIWTTPLAELVAGLGTYPLPKEQVVYLDRIKPGVTDSDSVYWVQRALGAPTTGNYDQATVDKAKAFQRALSDSDIDGDLGPLQTQRLFANFTPRITIKEHS